MKKALTFIMLGAASSALFASPLPSYNYAGVQFTSEQLDDYDCTQNGVAVSGSMVLADDIFALASFRDVSGDNCGSSTLALGGGYKTMLNEDISVYAAFSFENTSVDDGDSDSGLVVAGGIRSFVAQNLEANAELSYRTAFDGDLYVSGGLNYWFAPKLALTGEVAVGGDSTNIEVGVRLNF